ncbi:MAG: hypothetical protein AAGD25_03970 [Cyanobacteria bacterium P01_F01_bin.150]
MSQKNITNITKRNGSQAIATELTFHYLDGRNESFTVYESLQPSSSQSPSQPATSQSADQTINSPDLFQHHVRHLLGKDWWVLQLQGKSVLINMDTVVKVEINPPLSPQTDDIVAQVENVDSRLLDSI